MTRGKEGGTESSGTFTQTRRDRNNSCTTRVAVLLVVYAGEGVLRFFHLIIYFRHLIVNLLISLKQTCLALLTITRSSLPGSVRRTQSFSGIGSAHPTHRRCWKTGKRVDAGINGRWRKTLIPVKTNNYRCVLFNTPACVSAPEFRTSGRRSATTGAGLTGVTNGNPVMIPTVRGHVTVTCDPWCFLLLRIIMTYHYWNVLLVSFLIVTRVIL